jgi:hypothetical protein
MNLRSLGAVILATVAVASPARAANSILSDVSDMWWNSAESGWGMNATLQANVLFITLYVYSSDAKAHWFVAPNMGTEVASPPPATQVYSGALYETTGPVFSGVFNPNAVNSRMVGTATFEYTAPLQGKLTYTVDGVTVVKTLKRESWAVNDPSGTYAMTLSTRSNTCSPGVITVKTLGTVNATLANGALTLVTSNGTPIDNCTFRGDYSQDGHIGTSNGTYQCSQSGSGPYSLSEMEVGTHGFMARFDGTISGCPVYGNLAGARTTVAPSN